MEREWVFDYSGGLSAVLDPMGYRISMSHDDEGRIRDITDKHDPSHGAPIPGRYVFDYSPQWRYDPDALFRVTDPKGLVQEFRIRAFNDFTVETTYTDRRGEDWVYGFTCEGSCYFPVNGPVDWTANPLGEQDSFEWDGDRNKVVHRDALLNEWVYSYDDRGNMLTATDPLDNVQTWTYDEYNNVTSFTDGEGNTTQLFYDVPGYPTLLTERVEPPDGQGNPEASTTLAYYLKDPPWDDPAPKHGLLKEVEANGVTTSYDYDTWGQLSAYREGQLADLTYVYRVGLANDSGSRPYSVVPRGPGREGRGMGATMSHNLNNNMTGSTCFACKEGGVSGPGDFPVPAGFPKLPCDTPGLAVHWMDWSATHTPMGQVELMNTWGSTGSHEHTYEYDELNELTAASVDRDEWGTGVAPREFTYTREIVGGFYTGKMTRLGPDGVQTIVQLDVANRTESVVRRIPDPGIELIRADYTYYANGLVHTVTYGNGAVTEYTYDDAGQVTIIDHRNEVGLTMLQLRYYYDGRGLPWLVAEEHAVTRGAQTTFAYDDRGRLIEESRSGQLRYWRGYEYDQGGNRVKMSDPVLDNVEVVYHYDLEDAGLYGSANNRLVYSEKFDTSTGAPVLVSTTYYYYNDYGNVTRVVTKKEDPGPEERQYATTWLKYAANGVAVTFVLGERWDWDGVEHHCPANYTIDYAREFWYDGPRQRYLNRELDPVALLDDQIVPLSETWSDYDGDEIYGDFTIDAGEITVLRSFEMGIARIADPLDFPNRDPYYYHTDHLGTTRGLTHYSSIWVDDSTYSAFGELIDGANHRYGYVGSAGYQAHADIPYLHVGWRYYDPGIGRFLERDPVADGGGLNVYQYCFGNPVVLVDPGGTWPFGALQLKGQYDGYRRQGKSPAEASKAVAEGIRTEVKIAGAMACTVGVGAVAYHAGPVAWAGAKWAGPHILRAAKWVGKHAKEAWPRTKEALKEIGKWIGGGIVGAEAHDAACDRNRQ